jgi:ribosomal 30S subunit maturation factor RimM
MAGDRTSAIVVMGEIVDSYGVRGWLKVRPFTESPDALLAYTALAGESRARRNVDRVRAD